MLLFFVADILLRGSFQVAFNILTTVDCVLSYLTVTSVYSFEMTVNNRTPTLARSYYLASVDEFLQSSLQSILGEVVEKCEFTVEQTQRDSWIEQIKILKGTLREFSGTIFLEFNIPRMGRRIDAVLITKGIVFVIEFKIGETEFNGRDLDQVLDYAVDLKNFHEGSHSATIVPILVASAAASSEDSFPAPYPDAVFPPIKTNEGGLREVLQKSCKAIEASSLDGRVWGAAPYHPTPTIIEAAQGLYAQHSVESIARNDAGAKNLRTTSRCIESLIDHARGDTQKILCFVTGVPGAGKTLVGLDVAAKRRSREKTTHAVFLSGNGPLVAVLREALARDQVSRFRERGIRKRKSEVSESIKAFIQNVHHFRDEALRHSGPPIDHVVIFDEAQRAWNREMTSSFMQAKRKQQEFSMSEPEFLLSYLNRHRDWAVVVCLVGGGQEINRGEAGISEWLDAAITNFPDWKVYISPELHDSEYGAGGALERVAARPNTFRDPSLHLSVSMRSFRAEDVSAFVKACLDCDLNGARASWQKIRNRFPLALTRDLGKAKQWVRTHARGSERYGLLASSEAERLKPHAIDIRVPVDPVQWFLNDKGDTHSSYYLEDAATEFRVQGLELDWTCVTWDGDLRYSGDHWEYHSFWGSKWRRIHSPENRNHLRNAYRVLLTRARQGMVIFVPEGASDDPTRAASFYDPTFEYLRSIGISVI